MSTDIKINLGGSMIRKLGDDLIPVEHGDWYVSPDGKIDLLPPVVIEIVAQRVYIYLSLRYGEYFVDTSKGFPYTAYSFYKDAVQLFDNAMKEYILSVEGVNKLLAYRSELNKATRSITVFFDIESVTGQVQSLEVSL